MDQQKGAGGNRRPARRIVAEDWFKELWREYSSHKHKFFLLHNNVRDIVFVPYEGDGENGGESKCEEFPDIRSYLVYQLMESVKVPFDAVVFYNLTRGFYTFSSSKSAEYLKSITKQDFLEIKRHTQYVAPPKSVIGGIDALNIIGQILRVEGDGERHQRVAVIIDHAENLVPKDTFENLAHEKMVFLEILRELSLDIYVQKALNMLILITENQKDVEKMIFQGDFYHPIRISFPSLDKRMSYLNFCAGQTDERKKLPPLNTADFPDDQGDEGKRSLARAFTGFTLRSISSLTLDINAKRQISGNMDKGITREDLTEFRRRMIEKDSAELLQEVKTRGGFECVGGLEYIKNYFREVSKALREGRTAAVPKQILLAGPPGTGKSILAEALANDAGIPVVRMKNIMDKYVGESERKLEVVLNTLEEMQPIIVFIDEVDQVIGQRVEDTSGDGAGRTEARMFGRLLEFMGDDKNRGKVVWIGASNRPDKLDDAMLRRFDRRFPVLLPYALESRISILEAFAKGTIPNLKYALDEEAIKDFAEKMKGYTGSEMEQVVRNAIGLQEITEGTLGPDSIIMLKQEYLEASRKDFITSRNEKMYQLQTFISINMCNNAKDLPDLTDDLPADLRTLLVNLGDEQRQSEAKEWLGKEIEALKQQVWASKR